MKHPFIFPALIVIALVAAIFLVPFEKNIRRINLPTMLPRNEVLPISESSTAHTAFVIHSGQEIFLLVMIFPTGKLAKDATPRSMPRNAGPDPFQSVGEASALTLGIKGRGLSFRRANVVVELMPDSPPHQPEEKTREEIEQTAQLIDAALRDERPGVRGPLSFQPYPHRHHASRGKDWLVPFLHIGHVLYSARALPACVHLVNDLSVHLSAP